jgi:hypothetical protein
MYVDLRVKYQLFLSDFFIKLLFSRQIFEKKKSSNIKFHENSSSGGQVLACGRADMTKLIVAVSSFAKGLNASRPTVNSEIIKYTKTFTIGAGKMYFEHYFFVSSIFSFLHLWTIAFICMWGKFISSYKTLKLCCLTRPFRIILVTKFVSFH